jgi:P27 family predicted phage terminase small subunit
MTIRAPSTLSPEAKRWFKRIQQEYHIVDQPGLLLLQTAMEALDRMRECQRAIERDGSTVQDRFGQTKAHPLLATERDARAQLLSAIRQLDLGIETDESLPWRTKHTAIGG